MGWWLMLHARRLLAERGAEVPEYVIVVAVVAMLAVVGLISVKNGLLSNLSHIAACLATTATGSDSGCPQPTS